MLKFFVLAILLTFSVITSTVKAINARAFIVNNHSDTILGEIKLTWFNQTTGAVIINSFDQEPLHYEVWFRPVGKKRFKRFTANEIKLFSFRYQDQSFEYRSFNLHKKSWHKFEREEARFLLLVHRSKVKLYKDVQRAYSSINQNVRIDSYYTASASDYHFYDYYLYKEGMDLIKATKTKERPRVKDLLLYYGIEIEFVKSISKNANFKDLPLILEEYIEWTKLKNV